MSQNARESLWTFEVYREWVFEVHEDHIRYVDYYEDIVEIDFGANWL